jgi:hypothetical protein
VIAHELAHDYMHEQYKNIKDQKIVEGWAEYVASRVNSLYGRESMNIRMEKNPSSTYGDGYRLLASIARKGDAAVDAFLKTKNDASASRL